MGKNLNDIELFLFDLDGTVYIGDTEIEGSFAAVQALREAGKKVCVFTNNSSRNHDDYVERLNRLGFSVSPDEVLTSGQITCDFLQEKFTDKRVFLLGNDRLKKEFLAYQIDVVDDNPDVLVIGFDTSLTYQRLYTFCKYVTKGLPYIATHPDYFCPAADGPMPDIGAFTEAIRLTTGRSPDYIMGKPQRIAGRRIAQKFQIAPEKIAMVGDRLYTDVAFAENCGFTSVLVLSGETDAKTAAASKHKADFVFDAVRDIPLALSGN